MADLKIKIGAVTQGLTNGLKNARDKVNTFGASVAKSIGVTAKMAFLGLAGAVTALSLGAIRAAANFEDTSVAFRVMIGDASKANKVIKDLIDFSTKTPFTPEEIFKTAKTLMAFGVTADDVGQKIRFLGDISAGTGKEINELARIYGKAFVKGKVQAEELNQLSEAGIPIIKALQKQYNATAAEIFKMGSRGELSFEVMQRALESLTAEGGIFFNMMEEKSNTMNGKISTLSGNWSEFLRNVGDTQSAKAGIDRLNKGLQDTNKLMELQREDPDLFMESVGGVLQDLVPFSKKGAGEAEARKRLGHDKAVTKEEIAAGKLKKKEREVEAKFAPKKKEDKKGTGTAAGLLSLSTVGGGSILKSMAGDITGGGFGSSTIFDKQLSVLQEIKENTRMSVKGSTTLRQDTGVQHAYRNTKLAISKGS